MTSHTSLSYVYNYLSELFYDVTNLATMTSLTSISYVYNYLSEFFYENSLRAKADTVDRNAFINW